MAAAGTFTVHFWGVRGSIPCPGPDYVRYGGNTSCLEVRCGEHLIVLDGGTGLRPFGKKLDAVGARVDADVFFSHTHTDHISGLPFFSSAFRPQNHFRLWAGNLLPDHTLRDVLRHPMREPVFPVPLEILKANISFVDFNAGETLEPQPGIVMKTARLNHPNGATGYRIEYDGHAICYVTDTEHHPGKLDENVLALIAGADIVIYDSTFTDEEFPQFVTWGHSTWQEGVRLCDRAGTGQLVLFHHDPNHDDAFMDGVAKAAGRARPGTIVAREGMTLSP